MHSIFKREIPKTVIKTWTHFFFQLQYQYCTSNSFLHKNVNSFLLPMVISMLFIQFLPPQAYYQTVCNRVDTNQHGRCSPASVRVLEKEDYLQKIISSSNLFFLTSTIKNISHIRLYDVMDVVYIMSLPSMGLSFQGLCVVRWPLYSGIVHRRSLCNLFHI